MTKAQLVAELESFHEKARTTRCECCGMMPKEWDETPLLDDVDDAPVSYSEPVFVPTCWPAAIDVEEPDDYQEDDE